jgi:hypothetical protein
MPPQNSSKDTGLTVVATVSGMLRAEILKSKLESAGIPALLNYESAGTLFGITASGLPLSEVRILVAGHDAEEAIEILNALPPDGWEEEANDSGADYP